MKQQLPELVVVELPPACAGLVFCSSISSGLMEDVIGHIRKLPRGTPVLAFFVGEGFTDDSLQEVQVFPHGANEKLIGRICWAEKSYGHLSGWMDNGVGKNEICSTLKHLRELGEGNYRNPERKVLKSLAPAAMSVSYYASEASSAKMRATMT